ncbi:MAG TPA: hypothetical protein VMT64_11430 [Candidatus Binataceae bacterium]|nr:hypothetical protein [Candidatus Binataceae bacterium]
MKRVGGLFALALVGVVMVLGVRPAFAFGQPKLNAPKTFQADFSISVGAQPAQHGVMYFSHGRIREEIAPGEGSPKSVRIIDPLDKTIYQIDADKKAFRIEPWDPHAALISEALKRSGKHRFVQTQTINGQECDNFEILPKDKDVKPFFVFINRSTRYPVLLTTQDPDPSKEIHIEWSKLAPGIQAPMLFTPPLGYAELK